MKQRQTGIAVARSVIWSPNAFYADFEPTDSYRFPLAYVAACALLGGFLFGGVSAALNLQLLSNASQNVTLVSLSFALVSYLTFLCHAAATHIVATIFGARGFRETVEAMAYPAVLMLTLGWVPVVNLAVFIYGLSLQAKGVRKLHRMNGYPAGSAVVLGAIFAAIFLLTVLFIATTLHVFILPAWSLV